MDKTRVARLWIILAIVLIVATAAFLYFGIRLAESDGSASCGGSDMQQGDTCITYHNGTPEKSTDLTSQREQNAAESHSFGWIMLVIALIMIIQLVGVVFQIRKALARSS